MEVYIEDKEFDKLVFSDKPLEKGEYENCIFTNCDFSNADLSKIIFSECEFVNCNLSMAKLQGTAFRKVKFTDCKLLGLNFENCNPFGLEMSFEHCVLDHSIFYKTNLKNTSFINSQIHEADFTESDLTHSIFEKCDLQGATFENTILEKANLKTAYNFQIDPEKNRIKKAKFSTENISGLLAQYDIKIEK